MGRVLPLLFLLQGGAMFFDEFYFHRRRGLPLWERVGHPLDTSTVLLCYLYLFFENYSPLHLEGYLVLLAFSCFFVTKDEWIHKKNCEAGEQWLHSLLFILHPVTLLLLILPWSLPHDYGWMIPFLKIQFFIILAFGTYQIIYWNFLCKTELET